MVKRRTTVWVDASGRTRACLLTTSAGGASVQAAIAAVSNAAIDASWEGDLTITAVPSPVAATYPAVTDTAELLYQTGSGDLVKIIVPAPHASIFMADGETVDPATITGLTAQVIADVVTPAGTAITAYVAGIRTRPR